MTEVSFTDTFIEDSREVAFQKAEAFLREKKVKFSRKSEYHLKIFGKKGRSLNYYPTRGTFHEDNKKAFPEHGLEALGRALVALHILQE